MSLVNAPKELVNGSVPLISEFFVYSDLRGVVAVDSRSLDSGEEPFSLAPRLLFIACHLGNDLVLLGRVAVGEATSEPLLRQSRDRIESREPGFLSRERRVGGDYIDVPRYLGGPRPGGNDRRVGGSPPSANPVGQAVPWRKTPACSRLACSRSAPGRSRPARLPLRST